MFFGPFGQRLVDLVSLIRKILSSSNGCELIENGHRFVKLRKYLCFCLFMQQRKIFSSTERTFAPKQTQYAPKNSCTSDFFPKGIQRSEVRASSHQTILVYPLIFRKREPKVRGSNVFMSHNRALMKKRVIVQD